MTPSNARVSLQVWAVSSISGMFTLKTLIMSLDIHLLPAWKRGAKGCQGSWVALSVLILEVKTCVNFFYFRLFY
jgi:hypothetical protein